MIRRPINEALKHVADMLGCMTYIESTSRLTVVGEELADILRDYTRPIQVVDACDLH